MRSQTRPTDFRRALRACILLLLGLAASCAAQEPRPSAPPDSDPYTLTCSLRDTQGRPVPGLIVELASSAPATHMQAPTAADGAYTFRGLPGAVYRLTVAGGIVLDPREVRVGPGQPDTVVLKLPITLPAVAGRPYDVVSVRQLDVPEKVQDTLHRAFDACAHNDIRQSRALANRTLQMRPNYGPALSLLGYLDLQEDHPAAAVAELLQAVVYNPDSYRTYFALASAYNQLHQNANALHALSLMAKFAPDIWQLHYETGRAYLGQGLFEAALAEFNRALAVGSTDASVLHVGKAHALLGLKDYPSARTELDLVIQQSPHGAYTAESRELALALDSYLKKSVPVQDATAREPATPEH